ncbi:PEP-CTERM sorting domain-containing protein [Xylophilus rhododendri]|uniref:PEP-CTERM sorting domain-containing protein n=1 Tax=Xylophilus rhododendri TaxID=2697032 RepID=A0A857J314_9BURK|nr:FxDxF family PEP-CTERM protein [Xylophilus rhododendri]QHI98324.1 PEP-CTERM sorting domain-containing protein [Xylophilus rhododendri]
MTTVFKKIAIASAVALSLGATSLSANAAVELIGLGSTSFDTTFTTNGLFTTFYNFTVVPNSGSALSDTSLYLKNSGVGVLLSSLSLYQGLYTSTAQLAGLTAATTASYTATNSPIQHPSLDASTTLSAGTTYTLVTYGKSVGASLAAPVSFNTQFVLAAVPEPETYAMLLAGLGVMGFVARRRKTNTQA